MPLRSDMFTPRTYGRTTRARRIGLSTRRERGAESAAVDRLVDAGLSWEHARLAVRVLGPSVRDR